MSTDSNTPDDKAGPLVGWSLASGLKQKPIDELVDFPCDYTFKVVCVSSEGMSDRVAQAIGAALKRDVSAPLTSRRSSGGNYESVTFHLHVESGDEVYAVYAALKALEEVRFAI